VRGDEAALLSDQRLGFPGQHIKTLLEAVEEVRLVQGARLGEHRGEFGGYRLVDQTAQEFASAKQPGTLVG
jgi:hypothetical protein